MREPESEEGLERGIVPRSTPLPPAHRVAGIPLVKRLPPGTKEALALGAGLAVFRLGGALLRAGARVALRAQAPPPQQPVADVIVKATRALRVSIVTRPGDHPTEEVHITAWTSVRRIGPGRR